MKTSTYLKSGLATLSVAALIALSGCGGSSGTSSISGTVQASIIKGATVCIAGTTNCATTDANGRFTIAGFAPPQTLEIKVGNSVIGSVSVNSATVAITPKLLADGNTTLAPYIGLLLHEAAGCNITDELCDLSGVTDIDINQSSDKPLIEELKEALDEGNTTISLVVDGNTTKEINETEVTEYETENPEMTSDTISYAGAANVGDFSVLTYDKDNKTVTYSVKGDYNETNTTQLISIPEDETKKLFFVDGSDNVYFFTKNIAAARIHVNGQKAILINYQTPSSIDTSLIVNKTFNYLEINGTGSAYKICGDGTLKVPRFAMVDINSSNDGNDNNGTWTAQSIDCNATNVYLSSTIGTWEVNTTAHNIILKDDTNTTIGYAVIRPAVDTNGRAAFIVDKRDSERGFGIGIEATTVSDVNGTYYYYSNGADTTNNTEIECVGKATVSGMQATLSDYACKYVDGNDTTPEPAYELNLTLNPIVTIENNISDPADDQNITLTGLVQFTDNAGDLIYGFIDPVSGYFMVLDLNNTAIGIGSNKPLQ